MEIVLPAVQNAALLTGIRIAPMKIQKQGLGIEKMDRRVLLNSAIISFRELMAASRYKFKISCIHFVVISVTGPSDPM